MASGPRSVPVAVFGPFRFDLTTRELRKHDIHLRLEEKPALVLQRLIRSAGAVVARKELQEFLWPNGIHVDFNHGLNKSINRLRAVLGDDLDQPRYIQTLSKRGYRFISPVEISTAETVKADLVKSEALYPVPRFASDLPASGVLDQREGPAPGKVALTPWFRYRKAAFAGAMLGIVLLVSSGALRLRHPVNAASNLPGAVRLSDFGADPDSEVSFPSTSTFRQMANVLPNDRRAARWYVQGLEKLRRFETAAAQRDFLAASNIEPGHALTHSALSTTWSKLGHNRDAQRESQRAFDLSLTLPLESRLVIEGQLKETRYDWMGAIETYKTLFQHYPDNLEYGLHTASVEIVAGRGAAAVGTLELLRKSSAFAAKDPRIDLVEADAAASFSDFKRQRQAAHTAFEKSRILGASLLMARAEVAEGEAMRGLGNYPDALALWDDARQKFESSGDRSAVARTFLDEGHVRWQQGKPSDATESYGKAIAISRAIGDDANLGRALTGLGQFQLYYAEMEKGRETLDEALSVFRGIGNQQEEAYTLSFIADSILPRYNEAKELYARSLLLSRAVNDRSRTAGRLMDLGIIAMVQGDLPLATQNLKEALQIYQETGERNRAALQLTNLAIVGLLEGKLREAKKLAEEAISILSSLGERVTRAEARVALARIELECGEFADAEATIYAEREDYRQAQLDGGVADSFLLLADLRLAQHRYTESRDALRQSGSIPLSNEPKGQYLLTPIITNARLYEAEGKHAEALEEAKRALNRCIVMGAGSSQMQARLTLAEIELRSGPGNAGRLHLKQLEREARLKGFGLIAEKARKALQS